MTFKEWFEEEFNFPYDLNIKAFSNIFNVDKVEGMRLGWEAAQKQGVRIHDGQRLMLEYILNNDKGISETTKTALEILLK